MTTIDPEKLNSILATDCGSTTTKAILIERRGSEYRLIVRGEAPTTAIDLGSSSKESEFIGEPALAITRAASRPEPCGRSAAGS